MVFPPMEPTFDVLERDDPLDDREQDHRDDDHFDQIQKNSPERLNVILSDLRMALKQKTGQDT